MRYETLILNPLREMFVGVVDFIPTLFMALAILIIGWVVSRMITKLFVQLLRAIKFDKLVGDLGLGNVLKTGGVKEKPSTLIGCITYWVLMVMVLMMTIKAFGVTIASDFLDKIFVYIPSVVIGALTLIVGMLVAKVISGVVYVTAKNTDMPIPETLRELTKFAIVAYVTIIYLTEIGFLALFTGAHYTIFMGGIVLALALAFGLAGRDVASKYLEFLKK